MAKVLIEESTLTEICDAIRAKKETTDAIPVLNIKSEIESITGGGESSDLVKYVSFMSEDGSTELFKMPVLSGDDCKDPIEHGDIQTPTKESTEAYNYTFSGWAMIAGDPAAASPLANITEDRTVYAAFEESTRYYNINYYDDDGVTLLYSDQLIYGSTPSNYTPLKDNYKFVNWSPELVEVTEDANYIAIFEYVEVITFADATWEKIAEISEAGEAQNYFTVGDTKQFEIIYSDGTSETAEIAIAGFDVDTLSDGSGQAKMSLVLTHALTSLRRIHSSYSSTTFVKYGNTELYSWLVNTLLPSLPTELQSMIKQVNKTCKYGYKGAASTDSILTTTLKAKVWTLSKAEVSTTYTLFADQYARIRIPTGSSDPCYWWLRDHVSATDSRFVQVGLEGAITALYAHTDETNVGVVFGFCI